MRLFSSKLATLFAFLILGGVTASGSAQSVVHFTASGDYAMTSQTDPVLRGVAALKPDFHVALGDMSYGKTGQEASWCKYVTDRVGTTFPFQLISGNAESSGTTNGLIENFARCLPNRLPGSSGTYGRQWYADVPATTTPTMRVILASAGLTYPDLKKRTYAVGTPEYQWLSDSIDQARAKGIRWIVVGTHYPCLSIGVYGCGMGKDAFNLLVSKKVDLVLLGHEHNYSRTYQLGYGTGCSGPTQLRPAAFVSACIRDRDASMAKGAGTVFAIVGTGGTTLRSLTMTDSELPYFAAYSGLNQGPSWGSLDVTASSTGLRAQFVPAIGTFRDVFTIGTFDSADRDGDGVLNTVDWCPNRPGPTLRHGCPLQFLGTPGNDTVVGTPLGDYLLGYGGNDILRGGPGTDHIHGGAGRDTVYGGPGNDVINGGTGIDTIVAGYGKDTIRSRDGVRDAIFCGPDFDKVIADRLDLVRGCEYVLRG